MNIKIIKAVNFRNYDEFVIQPSELQNVIYGKNAQGKTNILEALYLCSTTRSFRTRNDDDLVKFDKEFYNVEVVFNNKIGECKIEVAFLKNKKLKLIKYNDKKLDKLSKLLGKLNIVIFSPDDLRVIKEGPEERRKYIDLLLSQIKPSYLHNLQSYVKILKQRNLLLKKIRDEGSNDGTLDAWNTAISDVGSRIIYERMLFIDKFSKNVNFLHHMLSGGNEELSLKYESVVISEKDLNSLEAIKKNYTESLIREQKKDVLRASTSVGPHRDDIEIVLNGKRAKFFCSQGQQRTALIAMKLGEVKTIEEETGEKPVVLLDDVMSELDSERKSLIYEGLNNTQTFITSTNKEGIGKEDIKGVKYIFINNGKVFYE